jgi:hypothetical protein
MSTERIWRDIRGLRADPPGRAGEEDDRRDVFVAALQQAEELHGAASVSGFASRPLPLFYSLSQGGRAIAAAQGLDTGWAFHGHGLGVAPDQEDDAVMAKEVEPHKKGAFPLLSEITGSAPLPDRLSLGAMLASLPEVAVIVEAHIDDVPALELSLDHETANGEYMMLAPPLRMAAVYFGPEKSLPGDHQLQAMETRLAPYPRAKGWVIRPTQAQRNGKLGIGLRWPVEEGDARGGKALDVVATRYGPSYYLRPGLGEDGSEVNVLMTWWASLFTLSSLARYEPALWGAALDLNSSKLAVVLEEILEVAQERVPELLYETLAEERVLETIALESGN